MNHDDDAETSSFREAMRGVRRLRQKMTGRPAGPKPAPKARFTRADRAEVLKESLLPPADEALLQTGDELSFRRPHVPEAVLVRLRRGHFTVDGEIDLHGMTGAERGNLSNPCALGSNDCSRVNRLGRADFFCVLDNLGGLNARVLDSVHYALHRVGLRPVFDDAGIRRQSGAGACPRICRNRDE